MSVVFADVLYRVPLYRSTRSTDEDSLSAPGHGDELFNSHFPPPPLFPPPPPSWNGDTNAILREAIFISLDLQKTVSACSYISNHRPISRLFLNISGMCVLYF